MAVFSFMTLEPVAPATESLFWSAACHKQLQAMSRQYEITEQEPASPLLAGSVRERSFMSDPQDTSSCDLPNDMTSRTLQTCHAFLHI